MSGWQVTPEAVEKLNQLAEQIITTAEALSSSADRLTQEFEANRAGLGAHTASIARLLESVAEIGKTAEKSVTRLAVKVQWAAIIRKQHIETNPYAGQSGGSGGYRQTVFSGTVSYTDSKTGQRVEKVSTRTAYENKNIDPDAVIPAGTRYANGRCVRRDMTNLELMQEGKAPFVQVTRPDGSKELVPVELHHLSGEETRSGSVYFTGEERDGSVVEIASSTHDAYSRQLHIGNPSFRREADGSKSADAEKYNAFRRQYWKARAEKVLRSRQG